MKVLITYFINSKNAHFPHVLMALKLGCFLKELSARYNQDEVIIAYTWASKYPEWVT